MPVRKTKTPAPAASAPSRPVLTTERIDSQPSWIVRTDNVELAVTELGGHMAPVTFALDRAPVQPYYVSPWQNEGVTDIPGCMVPLRGDFFCLPFGANAQPYRGENHPAHGETSGSPWTLVGANQDDDSTSLHIRLDTKVRPGTVHRQFTLIKGHDAVYCRTLVEGFAGRSPFAHHANLRVPQTERALRISTSRFDIGRTYPIALANPAAGEYQWLARDAAFKSLSKVPSIFRDEAPGDCSAFPTRKGFCDLLQQFEKPPRKPTLSWVTAVNTEENWLWFAIKNPVQMPGRLFWIENHGRHGHPWNGRNSCLGIEDGCMYFDRGIAESSQPNPISRQGIPTHINFQAKQPYEVRYIQGAIPVPARFDQVAIVDFTPEGLVFHSAKGQKVTAPLDYGFLL
jgi:hypothetical protein